MLYPIHRNISQLTLKTKCDGASSPSHIRVGQVAYQANTDEITETTNLANLNVILLRFGRMNEKRLVKVLIGIQASENCSFDCRMLI